MVPRDNRFNDGNLVTADIGQYKPNAWGLYDMHGNAAEWTRTNYRPHISPNDDPVWNVDNENPSAVKTVRGGSWRDRPKRCKSSFRISYPAFQRVFNVGFRIAVED